MQPRSWSPRRMLPCRSQAIRRSQRSRRIPLREPRLDLRREEVCMTIARVVLAMTVLMLVARPALAQSVEAEALFREGKALLQQGKLAEACAKFDASDRLEPSVGTELNAADCHEKNGKVATAWAGFLKAAANAAKAGNDKLR